MKERHIDPRGNPPDPQGEWSENSTRRWVRTGYPPVDPDPAALARVEQRVLQGLVDTVYRAGRQRSRRLVRTLALVYCAVLALSMLGGLLLREEMGQRTETVAAGAVGPTSSPEAVRELNTHVSQVQSLVFAPDGANLVVGGGKAAECWVPLKGFVPPTTPSTWQTTHGTVEAVTFGSSTGAVAAAVQGHTVYLRSISSEAVDTTFTMPTAPVVTVAFSPNGELLAAAGKDSRILVWDIASKRQLYSLRAPGEIHILSFVPNGSGLAAAGTQLTIWTFGGTTTGPPLTTYFKDHGPFTALAFAAHDSRVAAAVSDGTVFIGNSITGEWRDSIHTQVSPVTALAISPDGNHLAAGHNTAVVYNLASGQQESGYSVIGTVTAFAFSPDSRYLAIGASGGHVRLWNLEQWRAQG